MIPERSFTALDGLRGIAALAVVSLHATPSHRQLLPHAYLSVDLFFCLSGWVLMYAYEPRFKDGLTIRRFMRDRFIRLFPLYALGTLIGFVVFIKGGNMGNYEGAAKAKTMATLVTNLAFVPVPISRFFYNGGLWFPYNFPAWSLSVEVTVNVIFAVIILRLRSSLLLGLIVSTGLLGLIATALTFNGLEVGDHRGTFLGGYGRAGFSFFAGALLYRAHAAGLLPFRAGFAWAALALLIVFALPRPLGEWNAVVDLVASVIIFPVIIAAAANDKPRPALRSVCSILGESSYAIYAIHAPLIATLKLSLRQAAAIEYISIERAALFPVALVIFLIGFALDRVYDTPVRRWLKRKTGG